MSVQTLVLIGAKVAEYEIDLSGAGLIEVEVLATESQ
jgi:hypothetical protein